MALPNKVVEQLGRAPVRTPGWSGRVLMFSATFLIISLMTYVGIRFGLKPFTSNQVETLNTQVAEFARQVPLEQQLEIAALYSQVVNLNTLLNQQVSQLDLFEWLQRNTNTDVQLTSVNLSRSARTLDIGGTARTLDNVGEQINVFLAQPDFVDQALLTGINPPELRSGAWDFQVKIVLNPQFYGRLLNPSAALDVEPEPVEEELTEEEEAAALDEEFFDEEESTEEESEAEPEA